MGIKAYITDYTLVNALGAGRDASRNALLHGRSGLTRCDFEDVALNTYIGRVPDIESLDFPTKFATHDNRINRLVYHALQQDGIEARIRKLVARYGNARVGLLIGTSTSGILTTEHAYRNRGNDGALPDDFSFQNSNDHCAISVFLQEYLGVRGVSYTISTACSSSARICSDGMGLLALGMCDAVVLVGADSLCLTTLYGFNSLELLSPEPCMPCDANRKGISIGEAAAIAILERDPAALAITGYGESSDGYHMSSPHPEGKGAEQAMREALARSGLKPDEIDYINMHGTGTRANDSAEDQAIARVFGTTTPASSTKGWTGHTLGAAGLTEVIFCALALETGMMPGTLGLKEIDPTLTSHILTHTKKQPLRRVLTNSFGFGGNNCSLVLEKEA
ncbi:MAG: fabB [Rickettsiales bacterium]|nr:fabB [Rickettsiales bacterium]